MIVLKLFKFSFMSSDSTEIAKCAYGMAVIYERLQVSLCFGTSVRVNKASRILPMKKNSNLNVGESAPNIFAYARDSIAIVV